jgi:penicillin-binding protein 1A
MGRDDAKPVPGLQGGTAPARAFHDFMSVAVANRPVEQFQTQVPMPDWQLTPEEQIYGDQPVDMNDMGPMVDENGLPIGTPRDQVYPPSQQPMVNPEGTGAPSQQDLDQAFPPQQPPTRRPSPYPPQPQPRYPGYPPRPPGYPPQNQPETPPRSLPPPDPSQPRPYTA